MKIFIFLFSVCTLCYSCEDPVEDKLVETKNMKYKYNIVGIAGEYSDVPYIEIRYTKDNGSAQNIEVKEMVSPPFVFGGHKINIRYDSIVSYMGNKAVSYKLELKHDYGSNGSEYLRIINHSDDKQIEFFIAGTQDMKTYKDGCRGLDAIETIPNVYYKNAPIYYLLFPEKKHTHNLVKHSQDCEDIFYFEGDRCGDFTLISAWNVNDVAKLYKAESKLSKDTILYIDPRYSNAYGRMSKALSSKDPYISGKTFYGIIRPKEELKGNDKIWLLATPWMFDWNIGNGEF